MNWSLGPGADGGVDAGDACVVGSQGCADAGTFDCDAAVGEMAGDLKEALACEDSGPCKVFIGTDECGCQVYAQTDTSSADAFSKLSTTFHAQCATPANCDAACGGGDWSCSVKPICTY